MGKIYMNINVFLASNVYEINIKSKYSPADLWLNIIAQVSNTASILLKI